MSNCSFQDIDLSLYSWYFFWALNLKESRNNVIIPISDAIIEANAAPATLISGNPHFPLISAMSKIQLVLKTKTEDIVIA